MKKNMDIPLAYHGREQAFIKHSILSTYLQRLFLIVGRLPHCPVINYVDCFSGPWEDESDDLGSTSIGISVKQMECCLTALNKTFNKNVKFRALYIEKNNKAYKRLKKYVDSYQSSHIELNCIHGDFTEKIDEIINWSCKYFTFFFIDPMGWKGVIDPKTLGPLLDLKYTEFLINLMYDFINRVLQQPKFKQDCIDLFGKELELSKDDSSWIRQQKVVLAYQNNMKLHYNGLSSHVNIERPGEDRTLYSLVYLTRHPKGIIVFKEETEKSEPIRIQAHAEAKLRKQLNKTPTLDLFGSKVLQTPEPSYSECFDVYDAKEFLVDRLSNGPICIDIKCWANFLERTVFHPSVLQSAMMDLEKEGKIKNLNSSVSRRTKNIVNYRACETWTLVYK